MDRDQDDLVVGHAPDDFDDMLGILGGETAGRLVEEIDIGRADHIEADVQTLAFASAEHLLAASPHDLLATFVQTEFGKFTIDTALTFASREMRGADGRGEAEILLDRQLFIEGVVLRDVGDVLKERIKVLIEGALIELHLAGDGRELAGQGAEEGALAATTRSHDTDHLAAINREVQIVECRITATEPTDQIANVQRADDVPLLLDDAVGEVAAEHLAGIDPNGVAIDEIHGSAHRKPTNHDGPVCLKHLHAPCFFLIITGDPKCHLTTDSG